MIANYSASDRTYEFERPLFLVGADGGADGVGATDDQAMRQYQPPPLNHHDMTDVGASVHRP